MKRLFIATTAAIMMLCPITAYGAQSEDALAVYQEMMTTTVTLSDINTYLDANIHLAGSGDYPGDEETYDFRLEMNTRLRNRKDLANLQLHSYARLSASEYPSESFALLAYYEKDYLYLDDMDGTREKISTPQEELLSVIESAKTALDLPIYFMKDLTLRTEGDLRILDYTLDDGKINDLLKGYLMPYGSSYSEYETAIRASNLKGFFAVTPQGYLSKAYLNIDIAVTSYGESIRMNLTVDLGIADPGQPVAIDVPNLKEFSEY